MKTKVLVILSLFVAMGVALHTIIPSFVGWMKPDMSLVMMFLGILLFPNIKYVTLLGMVTGVLSGLTTSFPGGLIPNIIDKIITAFIFFIIVLAVQKLVKKTVTAAVLTVIGTLISGVVFLTAALLIVGLPGGVGFIGLFTAVVLPAMLVNAITISVIYPIVQSILKRSNIEALN